MSKKWLKTDYLITNIEEVIQVEAQPTDPYCAGRPQEMFNVVIKKRDRDKNETIENCVSAERARAVIADVYAQMRVAEMSLADNVSK